LKIEYPTSDASTVVYSVDARASGPSPVSAVPTAWGPSSTRLSRNSGTGTTSDDHTTMESPFEVGAADRRATTLPIPHDSAPATHSRRASSGM
jgi:hypothetical protein